ncbi:hypothetical protein Hte_007040 [Hypoxylon texense]
MSATSTRDRDPATHTVDNERATWITLLSAIHQMEIDSLKWQTNQFNSSPPSSAIPPTFADHSLVVAIQRKQRSWDSMPSSIMGPYATTTICHIIEIAAMLGLHWKEFDRSKDNFLAEGNGFVLKATRVTELGTVFTFQLAFGFVSTIYRNTEDRRQLEPPAEEVNDSTALQLGTIDEFAETLVSLGCNTETSKCIRDNSKRHGHLFLLAFELLGMLGKIFHVQNSFFRVLPNPTFYHWNRQYFSLPKLLEAFKKKIEAAGPGPNQKANKHLYRLQSLADAIMKEIRPSQLVFSADLLNALHEALEFLAKRSNSSCGITYRGFLSMLNEAEEQPPQRRSSFLDSRRKPANSKPAFASLDGQSSEFKQDELIEIYFTKALPKITDVDPDLLSLTSGPKIEINSWCTLVFRSLCWLTLHDFHKNDKQIARKIETDGQ